MYVFLSKYFNKCFPVWLNAEILNTGISTLANRGLIPFWWLMTCAFESVAQVLYWITSPRELAMSLCLERKHL